MEVVYGMTFLTITNDQFVGIFDGVLMNVVEISMHSKKERKGDQTFMWFR